VGADRLGGDSRLPCGLSVGEASSDEAQHVDFAFGEVRGASGLDSGGSWTAAEAIRSGRIETSVNVTFAP
jgi:hypothetical protein